ncbi:hypothetical protein [Frigidibacter mobilis]|uniref:Uncharacterized protein n=1 Tax=Frigidibacter mobilis TaxID=1335048 RepID=A0A161GWH1_9RHOB|nr:hypothetical protein [Frigidibacter mobilis]AMY68979.1 hypothetical protein AKL17_1727 [Frigidibacter mobilis]
MTKLKISELLSQLPPAARLLLAERLRAVGEIAPGAGPESAFEGLFELEGDRDVLDCQDAYEAALAACETDECRAGAAFAMRSCMRACKAGHGSFKAAGYRADPALLARWSALPLLEREAAAARLGLQLGEGGLPKARADDLPPEPEPEPEPEDPDASPEDICRRNCFRSYRRTMQICAASGGDEACFLAAQIGLQSCMEGCRSD